MPYYPQDGLTKLGEAISGGARDYAGRQLALADEQRRRGYQLQDIAAARDFETSSYTNRLHQQAAQETALDLVHKGLLDPADIDNPAAIARASAESRSRALDEHYANLLSTPDPETGKPLLDRSQLTDPAAIATAETKMDRMMATANQLKLTQPGNAAASIDALAREAQQVRQKLAAVETKLAEPPPQIDQQVVMNRALQLAKDAKGGKTPSQQDIQSMVGQATQEAQTQALQRWYQEKEDAKVQQRLFADSLNSIRAQQSDLTKSFGVAPKMSVLSEPTPAGPARPVNEATPEQRAAALTAAVRSAIGAPAPGSTPPPAPNAPALAPVLPNPTSEPLIDQENQRIKQVNLGRQNSALADPYNSALDDLAAVNQQIAQVRSGAPAITQGPDEFGAGAFAVQRDPSMQAKALSDLLIRQQQVARDVEAKRRAMLGIGSADTPPVLSNASGSAPAAQFGRPDDWWQG